MESKGFSAIIIIILSIIILGGVWYYFWTNLLNTPSANEIPQIDSNGVLLPEELRMKIDSSPISVLLPSNIGETNINTYNFWVKNSGVVFGYGFQRDASSSAGYLNIQGNKGNFNTGGLSMDSVVRGQPAIMGSMAEGSLLVIRWYEPLLDSNYTLSIYCETNGINSNDCSNESEIISIANDLVNYSKQ